MIKIIMDNGEMSDMKREILYFKTVLFVSHLISHISPLQLAALRISMGNS